MSSERSTVEKSALHHTDTTVLSAAKYNYYIECGTFRNLHKPQKILKIISVTIVKLI